MNMLRKTALMTITAVFAVLATPATAHYTIVSKPAALAYDVAQVQYRPPRPPLTPTFNERARPSLAPTFNQRARSSTRSGSSGNNGSPTLRPKGPFFRPPRI